MLPACSRIAVNRENIGLCASIFLLTVMLAGCGSIFSPGTPRRGKFQIGMASWYGPGYHGNTSASGEIYNMYELTAAHKELPFGTYVRVTNLRNGKTVVVRINDRGPFKRGRIIDLSYAAARKIGMVREGSTRVRVEIVDR
jgi:rare lipoprotein A